MDQEYRQLLPAASQSPQPPHPTLRTSVQQRAIAASQTLLSRRFWKAVLLGQFISLLLCGTGVTSGLLSNEGVHIPTAQAFCNYVLLCLIFTVILACRRGDRNLYYILRTCGWKYFLVAVADVEANYLLVKAYQYTTVTSVQVLDFFSIPCVMVLSCLVLRIRYKALHITGVVVCVLGLAGLVLSDLLSGNQVMDSKAPNKALGDVLVIAGASLYSVSNTAEEYVVKTYDKTEFLAMLGLFGSFINGIQFALLESHEINTLDFSSVKVVFLLLGFTLCQFLLYTCFTIVIQVTSATAINISILSADFYSLLFGIFLFKYQFHVLYFISFVVIIIGIGVYTWKPTATNHEPPSSANQIEDTPTNVSSEYTCNSSSR